MKYTDLPDELRQEPDDTPSPLNNEHMQAFMTMVREVEAIPGRQGTISLSAHDGPPDRNEVTFTATWGPPPRDD